MNNIIYILTIVSSFLIGYLIGYLIVLNILKSKIR